MAGFIFSIYKEENIEGVKKCIRQGLYASKVPNDKLSVQENESSGNKSKQVMAGYWQTIVRCKLVIMCIFYLIDAFMELGNWSMWE